MTREETMNLSSLVPMKVSTVRAAAERLVAGASEKRQRLYEQAIAQGMKPCCWRRQRTYEEACAWLVDNSITTEYIREFFPSPMELRVQALLTACSVAEGDVLYVCIQDAADLAPYVHALQKPMEAGE
jgi:hypothetical protein